MDNIDERNLENDPTYQFLRNLSLPAEPSSVEDPPKKRTKIDNQNWYPIDRIVTAPDCFDLETGEKLASQKKDQATKSFSVTYSHDAMTDSQCVRQSSFVASAVWDVVDPKGIVRGITLNAPDAPVFNTGIVPFNSDKSTNIDKVPIRKVYHGCTLYPPCNENVLMPIVERPLGCRTVSITGLPRKMSSDMVMEVFSDCGRIRKIKRLKEKEGVVRITYFCESSVDKVLELNGYKVYGEDHHRVRFKGVIQVDFVPVWQEQQEYICKIDEQQKLKLKISNNVGSWESSDFSKEAIIKVLKDIRGHTMVNENLTNVLVRWMEKGECNKSNSLHFFEILSAMQTSISRLMNETAKLEESVRQQQSSLRAKYSSNSLYFIEILKAFNAATSKTVFNSFSSNMKSQIEMWKKYIEDINDSNSQDMINESNSLDMISAVVKEKVVIPDSNVSAQNSLPEQQMTELEHLQAENERLKKELRVAQSESSERYSNQIPQKTYETKSEVQPTKNSENDNINDNGIKIVEKEAHIISMIGAFLSFHRFGESIKNICRYLLKIDLMVTTQDIECLMRKLPTVFKEELIEGDNCSKTKWTLLGI